MESLFLLTTLRNGDTLHSYIQAGDRIFIVGHTPVTTPPYELPPPQIHRQIVDHIPLVMCYLDTYGLLLRTL